MKRIAAIVISLFLAGSAFALFFGNNTIIGGTAPVVAASGAWSPPAGTIVWLDGANWSAGNWYDSSGSGNDFTQGTGANQPTNDGSATWFDGGNDCYDSNASNLLDGVSSYSISAWFRITTGFVQDRLWDMTNSTYLVEITGTSWRNYWQKNKSSVTWNFNITLTEWFHITVVMTNDFGWAFYTNGYLAADGTNAIDLSPDVGEAWRLMGPNGGIGGYADGGVDDFMMITPAPDAAGILDIYNNTGTNSP